MNKKRIFIVLLVLGALGGIIAFSGPGNNEGDANDAIKIGVITDLSGPAAGIIGEPIKEGIDTAIELLDTNHTLEVLYEDYRSDKGLALSSYNALKLRGVDFFVLDGSPAAAVVGPEIQKDGNFSINPSSFTTAYADGHPRTCRLGLTADSYGPGYASVASSLGAKKVATLMPSYDAGVAVEEIFNHEAKMRGLEVINERYLIDTADFRTQLAKIQSIENIDVFIVLNYFASADTLFMQIHDIGINTIILTDHWTLQNRNFSRVDLAEGAYVLDYDFSPTEAGINEQVLPFVELFSKQYGRAPSLHSVLGHDIVQLLIAGLDQTENFDPETFSKYLTEHEAPFELGSGSLEFNKDCEVKRDIVVRRVENGEFVRVNFE